MNQLYMSITKLYMHAAYTAKRPPSNSSSSSFRWPPALVK